MADHSHPGRYAWTCCARGAPAGRSPWPYTCPTSVVQADAPGLDDEAMLANLVGLALLVILDTLTPFEPLTFVLHDMSDVPFD